MIEIRPAEASDAAAIFALHAKSFPSDAEAHLVDRLSAEGDVQLSLVAMEHGHLVGHVMFTVMSVTADGQPLTAAALAPVATDPQHRRQGIAAALIEAGLKALVEEGVAISFVLGDPAYYTRFGYALTEAAPYSSLYAGPHFMALRLDKSLPLPKSGSAQYAHAFSQLDS